MEQFIAHFLDSFIVLVLPLFSLSKFLFYYFFLFSVIKIDYSLTTKTLTVILNEKKENLTLGGVNKKHLKSKKNQFFFTLLYRIPLHTHTLHTYID